MSSRIDGLTDKFPQVLRSIILKADVLRHGVCRTSTLEEVGRWALPQCHFIFEWDREKHEKGDAEASRILLPEWFQFSDGTTTCIMIDSRSPYTVEKVDGKYVLCTDGKPVEELYFQPIPKWYSKKASDGTPLPVHASQEGADSLCSVIFHHCQYFNNGDQCKFCNFNPTVALTTEIGREFRVGKNPELVAEAYSEGFRERGFHHVRLSAGSLLDRGKEAETYSRFIMAIKEAIGKRRDTLYGEIVSQAFDSKDASEIYDSGIEGVCWNLEQWDPEKFRILCPGKAKAVGRDRWLQLLIGALDYWGAGKVTTSFVLGPEMVPPHGFKTLGEAYKSWMEGFEWLITHDIIPRFNQWSPDVGSLYQEKPVPPTEYYLKVGEGWHELMKKYGMYPQPTQVCYKCIHKSIWIDFYHLC